MAEAKIKVRTGQAPQPLARQEFHLQFMRSFKDPTFEVASEALAQVEQVAWQNYDAGRKAPVTQKAGSGFADPGYDLSVEWKATRDRLLAALQVQDRAALEQAKQDVLQATCLPPGSPALRRALRELSWRMAGLRLPRRPIQ